MKAVNNAGTITFYQSLPNSFRSSTGLHLNVKDLQKRGLLFNIKIPELSDE